MLKILLHIISGALLACLLMPAYSNEYQPDFSPGYRPDLSTDEGGFWYQVDKFEKQIKESPELIVDAELNAYVKNITCKITPDYCPFIRIYIIKSPHFNASMFPNGMMHIWSGLLLRVKNEAELATVIAHEIAHFLRSHQIQQWRRLKTNTSISIFFDAFLTMGLATLGAVNNAMAFSRDQESEADLYGLQLMSQAGYSPYAASSLWEYVYKETENDKTKQKQNSFFASHPKTKDRLLVLKEKATSIDTADKFSLNQEAYVNTIAPHYFEMMKSHLVLRDIGRTEMMLQRHETIGYKTGDLEYFRAEMYKTRAGEGDLQKAIEHYKKSVLSDSTPLEAYRELGYLLTKQRDPEAKHYLQKYLDANPEASDKKMILFYLNAM